MNRIKGMKPSGSMIVAIIALVAALGGTAFAAATISGKDIKNNTVSSKKVKDKTLQTKDFSSKAKAELKGAKGDTGETGPQGPVGPDTAATYTNPNWAVIDRNTEGSPVATLAGGPNIGTAANQLPPLGVGSLHVETASNLEKVTFGNQVDFAGDPVSGLSQIGFSYFVTGEDLGRYVGNVPNISLEIDPGLTKPDGPDPDSLPDPVNYTSMVYVPPNPPGAAQQWVNDDADANAGGTTGWYFTNGTTATATGCNQTTFCSLAQAKSQLAAAHDPTEAPASILTVGVGKGKDYQFQGAIDALRINGTVYDFEPFGVQETPAS
jgi:hypothetical protein